MSFQISPGIPSIGYFNYIGYKPLVCLVDMIHPNNSFDFLKLPLPPPQKKNNNNKYLNKKFGHGP